ncbi:exopolysaccharide biosynthesis WecB/TagA/CpsF family protein [Novosphingobium sp. PhB57]|jgi:exopolysaccharide biosynthesis WecB/TagA/CpsF family protein|uniref:WecB/TagA/CpsF family glycosyltransferase n=1 Tax=unclassified Novosphingobium TaxID=2644732 RepID=UPI0010CEE529|nr:WecB/TagA/CpsF family glycosyltransferase [Novosphingobium sp. PhB57]TCU58715.1 exopolysaccharide biosynthesis WecB/TagA/CpsF family protein [Novosphingobium sp. PhB57]
MYLDKFHKTSGEFAPADMRELAALVAATSATLAEPLSALERPDPGPVEFLELAFTRIDMAGALDAIVSRPPSAPFAYVVTPNVDHVVRLQRRRSDLWPAYRGAWMTLCDSRILAKMARAVGQDLPVVTGSDLTAALFDHHIDRNDRVAILGGSEDMVARIAARYGLCDLHHYNPPMGFIRDPREVTRAVRFLANTKARYVFLAVGSPQQEIIARRLARAGAACGIGFCVGAGLEFLTGDQERAPRLMQQMSLEWLYRLGSDPQRLWRRYLIDGPQIFRIHQTWRRMTLGLQNAAGGLTP